MEPESIKCKGAVMYLPNHPLTIEEVIVDAPKCDEVRVKIYSSGVCHSDAHYLWGNREEFCPYGKPMINGHEAVGVIESIGKNVTSVNVGDHVVLLWMPQCDKCKHCKNPKSNLCTIMTQYGNDEKSWLFPDGSPRYRLARNGDPVLTPGSNCNLATFIEYAVVKEKMVAKIDPDIPLEAMCLFGCCVPTGFGSAVNVAKVHSGSYCAIWGLGAVGLACVMGCKESGADIIIGIDINPQKFDLAQKFGCNQFINPLDSKEPVESIIQKLLGNDLLDYAFDCIGNQSVINTALKCISLSGKLLTIGLTPSDTKVTVSPLHLLTGRSVAGALFGRFRGRDGVQKLVAKYKNDANFRQLIDLFVSRRFKLQQINDAFELMKKGENIIRSVIIM